MCRRRSWSSSRAAAAAARRRRRRRGRREDRSNGSAHTDTGRSRADVARPTAELGRLGTRAHRARRRSACRARRDRVLSTDRRADVFWQSYLIAYIFWIGITLGSLGVLMVQHLSGGAWGLVARRMLEASTRNLPLMARAVRADRDVSCRSSTRGRGPKRRSGSTSSTSRRAYLNPTFFYIRAGAVLRHLGRADLLPEQVVEGAGRAAGAAAGSGRPPVPRAVGPGPGAVRDHHHVHERRLGHVARPALVLDDLRHPRPSADRACRRWRSRSSSWRGW